MYVRHNVDKYGTRTPKYDPLKGIIHGFNHFVDSGEQLEKNIFSKLATVGRAIPAIGTVMPLFNDPTVQDAIEDVAGGSVGLAWQGLKLLRHNEGMFGYTETPNVPTTHDNHDNYVGHQKDSAGQAIPYMPIGWDFEGIHNNTNMDMHTDPRSYPVNNTNRGHMDTGHSQALLL